MILPKDSYISRQIYAETISIIAEVAYLFSERNWFLGTSGNISFKATPNGYMAITASGIDKGDLTEKSFVILDKNEVVNHFDESPDQNKPSHEYSIHRAIYESKKGANAIFHIHSLNAVLFADMAESNAPIVIENLEVLKGLGFQSYKSKTYLPILDNDDDPSNVALAIKKLRYDFQQDLPAVLIRNHGIFVWAESIFSARRHVELLDHIFAILLHRHKRAHE